MRKFPSVGIVPLCAGLLAWVALGCSSECKPFDTASPAPVFDGTFGINMISTGDFCLAWRLCTGLGTMHLVNGEGNDLVIEIVDCQGLSGAFSGNLCNTDDTQPPRVFEYNVTMPMSPEYSNPTIYYYLTGTVTEASAASKPMIEGSIMLSITYSDNTGESCSLMGAFDGSCNDCTGP
jgi:hypothetical protein